MDVIVLLTTFLLTVFFDLIIAIEIGIVLSSFLFMKRMSDSLKVEFKPIEGNGEEALFQSELQYDARRVLLYEINGPLFFGAAQQFRDVIESINTKPAFIIIRMRYVPFIDSTGFQRLKEIIRSFQARGITILISGVHQELKKDFEKQNLYALLSKDMVFEDIRDAIKFTQAQEG